MSGENTSLGTVTADSDNETEASGIVTISGTATGEFNPGDRVSINFDGTAYSATIAPNGIWSVGVPGSKLVAEASHQVNMTLEEHHATGNNAPITMAHESARYGSPQPHTELSQAHAVGAAHQPGASLDDSYDASMHASRVTLAGLMSQTQFVTGLSDIYYGAPSGGPGDSPKYVTDESESSNSSKGLQSAGTASILGLMGHDQALDLTMANALSKLSGLEVVDLTGDGQAHNSLKLSVQDVLDYGRADLFHPTPSHTVQMMVKGDSSDLVTLDHLPAGDGNWLDQGAIPLGDTSYTIYHHTTTDAELLVQLGIQIHLV